MFPETFDFSGLNFLVFLTISFIVLIILLITFISIYIYFLNRKEKNYKRWKDLSDNLITSAIFSEPEFDDLGVEQEIKIPQKVCKHLSKDYFRSIFIQELLSAKENMLGSSGENLIKLYTQLNLDKYALKTIKSNLWHKRAKAIKELGIMEQINHKSIIEAFLNDDKTLIRIEAQTAILKLQGFSGLRFLDIATNTISEWHQLKLLEELAQLPPDDFTGISEWFMSSNDSVVLFALKLVKNYHLFHLHAEVAQLLKHDNDEVRKQAIITIQRIPEENTAQLLIDHYHKENITNRLEILNALKEVAMSGEIPFLMSCLNDENIDIKFKAATTLSKVSPNGLDKLLSFNQAKKEPLTSIIKHINCTS